MSANGAIFITPTVQWTKENNYILFRLQDEGGGGLHTSFHCWKSDLLNVKVQVKVFFQKTYKRITIHSSQLQYSNTCLPAKVWVQTAHYAHHSLAWLRLP